MTKIENSLYRLDYLRTLNSEQLRGLEVKVKENMVLDLNKKEQNLALIRSLLAPTSLEQARQSIAESAADLSDVQSRGNSYE